MIERLVASVESVGARPRWVNSIAPWRRTIVLTESPESLALGVCFSEPPYGSLIGFNKWLSRQPRSLPYPQIFSNHTSISGPEKMHFSLPFFEILPSNSSTSLHARTSQPVVEDKDTDHWRFGKLYGDKYGRFLRYGAFNILSTIDYCVEPNIFTSQMSWLGVTAPFWTIIILGSFKSKRHPFMDRLQTDYDLILDEMTRIIHDLLKQVELCWRQIRDHLTSLISENANFMEGDKYVKLLFEDESYTRSRTYFWILGCLPAFENTIGK